MRAGIVWNGLWVLELAAVGDSRVSIDGDVKLELTSFRPHDSRSAVDTYYLASFTVLISDRRLQVNASHPRPSKSLFDGRLLRGVEPEVSPTEEYLSLALDHLARDLLLLSKLQL